MCLYRKSLQSWLFLTIPIRADDGKMSVIPPDGCCSPAFSTPGDYDRSLSALNPVDQSWLRQSFAKMYLTPTPPVPRPSHLLPQLRCLLCCPPNPHSRWNPSWQSCFSTRSTWCTWKSCAHSSWLLFFPAQNSCGEQTEPERRSVCAPCAKLQPRFRGGASRQAQTGSMNATHLTFPQREEAVNMCCDYGAV